MLGLTALVVAVAGSALAGPLATNSVLSKKEKQQTRNIVRGEIAKAAPNLSVKSSVTATSAANAQNATNSGQVDGHDAVCPPATFLQNGVCFDTALRFAMTPWNGATSWADAGGRLPSITELLSIRNVPGIDLGPSGDGHWADVTYDDGGTVERRWSSTTASSSSRPWAG